MAPSRFSSLRAAHGRGRPNPGSAAASRSVGSSGGHFPDDPTTASPIPQLIAFRYEQTIQAEPPIPLPPPRNPSRAARPATSISLPARSKSARAATDRPASALPPPLPLPLPVPLHLPPREQDHPALRTSHSSSQRQSQDSCQRSPSSSTTCADWKRDSAQGTLSSAASTTLPEDDDDTRHYTCTKPELDDTPTSTYSTDDAWPLPAPPVSVPVPVAPLRASIFTASSTTTSPTEYNQCYITHNIPRFSCQSRWSITESDVSDLETFRDKNSTRRLIRGLSLRLAPPALKRLKKQSQSNATLAPDEAMAVPSQPPASASPHDPAPAQDAAHQNPQGSPAPQLSSPPDNPGDLSRQEIGDNNDCQSPTSSNPGPLSSEALPHETLAFPASASAPTINTVIPQGDFLDNLEELRFSQRGSIYFGGKRAISAQNPPMSPEFMNKFTEPRPAPPAPASPTDSAFNGTPPATDHKHHPRRQSKDASVPDIRVLSGDTERESQKVRSLYESTDLVHWKDGAPGRRSGELLEPPEEVPSDGERNIAIHGSRENRKSVRAMYLSPTSPMSVTSLPSPRGSYYRRHEFELAGGIEDWEDVQGEDVDRYGFITAASDRPISRASHPAETRSLPTSSGTRHGRTLLTKRSKGPPLSQGLARIPSRKVSARSLNTQASALSAGSRLSVRSGVRIAANLLPYNRDRRIIDEAPDMLGLPPGLADIEEEQKTAQAIKAAQDLESSRAEKWRKMAKIITNVKDAKGAKVEAHDLKKDLNIKFDTEDLAKTGKQSTKHVKHLQIESMQIEFDTKNPKLIERTWKGIPDRWRSAAWYSFLATSAKNANSPDTDQDLIASFHRLQDESSPDDLQIDLDVPRTINKHIMFRRRYRGGQRLLFRVLHAMSLHFPDIGYVQGMAALAASLLCYYDEERCFVMLVRLWQYRGLERLYQEGFAGLMIALRDLEKRWLHKKPLSQKLHEMTIDPTAYGTRWYLTLFNLSIPFPIQLRVWDVFMLLGGSPSPSESSSGKQKARAKMVDEGEKATTFDGLDILHATAAALIDMHKDVILDADFENVMKSLTGFQQLRDENQFINTVRAEWNQHRKRKWG